MTATEAPAWPELMPADKGEIRRLARALRRYDVDEDEVRVMVEVRGKKRAFFVDREGKIREVEVD